MGILDETRMRAHIDPIKCLVLTGVLILISVPPCHSQEITSNILQRVFLIRFGERFGSSFTLDVQNRQYLITSRHLVEGIKDGDAVAIFHENEWKSIKVKPLYIEPKEIDMIVLVLPNQISPSHSLGASFDQIILAQPVYFLGFPYGLGMKDRSLNNGFPLPFVKRGTLSAFEALPTKKSSIIFIDGLNNQGFSGGPIVYVNQDTKQLTVAGVVSGYRGQQDTVMRKGDKKKGEKETMETDMFVQSNSGLVVGYSIESALEVIAKNPIGPLLKQ
jgi:hypothetical protein